MMYTTYAYSMHNSSTMHCKFTYRIDCKLYVNLNSIHMIHNSDACMHMRGKNYM